MSGRICVLHLSFWLCWNMPLSTMLQGTAFTQCGNLKHFLLEWQKMFDFHTVSVMINHVLGLKEVTLKLSLK